VAQPAEEEGAAEHQQHVGQDRAEQRDLVRARARARARARVRVRVRVRVRAEQRDLHDAQQPRLDREHRHDQLGHVAEGGVEEPAQPGTGKVVA
jgi:hypothetical protein